MTFDFYYHIRSISIRIIIVIFLVWACFFKSDLAKAEPLQLSTNITLEMYVLNGNGSSTGFPCYYGNPL